LGGDTNPGAFALTALIVIVVLWLVFRKKD
jgi:LPXTG-motif cell wall-anchored protein